MNRLQSELRRLYLAASPADAPTAAQPSTQRSTRSEPTDTVRALVIELTRPPNWEVLARVWYGVQSELELPAPAIAVSGIDAIQLWFSVAEPVQASQAQAFLEGLRTRFLPDIKPDRVRLHLHAQQVPALQPDTGNWSAFVAPDLAPVFDDTPWLDVAPNEEGQAALLRGLQTMKVTVFGAALEQLGANLLALPPPNYANTTTAVAIHVAEPLKPERAVPSTDGDEPRRFLLQVMNDAAVPMALRIEAAKALLQHSTERLAER